MPRTVGVRNVAVVPWQIIGILQASVTNAELSSSNRMYAESDFALELE